MNLLQDPWMPVRDADGRREWIAPERLSEPHWRAFDADRLDFNGALAQFAIGLLQTTTPAEDSIAWRRLYRQPPDAATLRQWFQPVQAAFELDGDGPRFMQDHDLGTEGVATNDIGALLIESPGDKTQDDNKDLFVKRRQAECLCADCAATALFTLQVNAPAGGNGHRTGLRGGGPLTTLVLATGGASLWHHLWINVRARPAFLAQGGDASLPMGQHAFPWLGPVSALQPLKSETAMAQVHPAHHFWAMPRRIRLMFEGPAQVPRACDLCGRDASRAVRQYATKNQGFNYKGAWNHPLSPYRLDAKEGWLPLHPQPDGLGYRHWLSWVLGMAGARRSTRAAPVVTRAVQDLRGQTGGSLRLWAFGYDMDNMKARCWYESTMPLYGLTDCEPDAVAFVQAEVAYWLDGAELASQYLRGAIKDAWFGHTARGDFAHVDAAFWSATEAPFYRHLQGLIDAARTHAERDPLPTREAWHRTLVQTALRLFDNVFVGTGPVDRSNPRRVALAHKQLNQSLHGPKLKSALGLPVPQDPDKPRRGKAAKPAAPASKESA